LTKQVKETEGAMQRLITKVKETEGAMQRLITKDKEREGAMERLITKDKEREGEYQEMRAKMEVDSADFTVKPNSFVTYYSCQLIRPFFHRHLHLGHCTQ
jgi:hypothetical protein